MLPISLKNPFKEHLKKVKLIHDKDLTKGFGEVYLPNALERKYPNANKQWIRLIYLYSPFLGLNISSKSISRFNISGGGHKLTCQKPI